MRLALSLTAVAVLVGGAPDPGIWTFPDITDPTSYTGANFNHNVYTHFIFQLYMILTGDKKHLKFYTERIILFLQNIIRNVKPLKQFFFNLNQFFI